MRNEPTPNAQANARELRRDMTDSERKLWSGLRREQLGVKFRRQHPVGNYIADFACLAPKMIVELDGSQHMEQSEYDDRRDAFFREQGFAVLRFATDAPLINLEGVRTVIAEELKGIGARCSDSSGSPHPSLPPEGEGESPHGGGCPHPRLPPEGEGEHLHPSLSPQGEGANTRSIS